MARAADYGNFTKIGFLKRILMPASNSHLGGPLSATPPPDLLLNSRGARLVFGALLCGFILSVALGLHRSSLGQWGPYLGTSVDSDVIVGKSRSIRSDEWLVGLAWNLSQARSSPPFQVENLSIGGGTAALFSGVTTYHWSAIFRPSLWGHLWFSEERGLSWQWSFATWGTLAALFGLLLLLTSGAVLVSLGGAAWLFFSPFTQWWFSTPYPNILFGAALSVTAALVCVHGSTPLRRWIAFSVLTWAATVFALTLYPPFLISVALVSLAAFITGFFLWRLPHSRGEICLRFGTVMVGAGIALLLVFRFFLDTADALNALQNTAYPGARISSGGGFSSIRLWSGLFGMWFSESRLPIEAGNVCEGSSFILLWPLVFFSFFDRRLRRALLPLIPLLGVCLLLTIWIDFSLHPGLAKLLGLTMVPEVRAQAGLGFASIVLSTILLAQSTMIYQRMGRPQQGPTFVAVYAGPLLIGLLTIWLGFSLGHGQVTSDLPTWTILLNAGALTFFSSAILSGFPKLFVTGVTLLVVLPGFLINPISRGLGAIGSSALLREVRGIGETDPTGRWIAYSDNLTPNLLMIAGVEVLNGMKLTPLNSELGLFDPDGSAKSIYNRLAQGVFHPTRDGTTGTFKLVQTDMWSLQVSPCDHRLKKLGVDYFVFLRRGDRDAQSCLIPLNETPLDKRFWLAKRAEP